MYPPLSSHRGDLQMWGIVSRIDLPLIQQAAVPFPNVFRCSLTLLIRYDLNGIGNLRSLVAFPRRPWRCGLFLKPVRTLHCGGLLAGHRVDHNQIHPRFLWSSADGPVVGRQSTYGVSHVLNDRPNPSLLPRHTTSSCRRAGGVETCHRTKARARLREELSSGKGEWWSGPVKSPDRLKTWRSFEGASFPQAQFAGSCQESTTPVGRGSSLRGEA